jgi:hypothetical protein
MTRMTMPGLLDYEYVYPAAANNGQITQRKDWTSGQEVNYQQDALKRLTAAWTTGPDWGQAFS